MNTDNDNILDPLKEEQINQETNATIDHMLTGILHKESPPTIDEEVTLQTRYVLGFAICEDSQKVLLIKKNRPAWQAGLLNGIGGKIEQFDESPYHAMQREFIEETGLLVPFDKWKLFNVMENSRFKISVFWTTCNNIEHFHNPTDEQVVLKNISDLFNNHFSECISNLSWLIPMILDKDIDKMHCVTQYLD